MKKASTFLLVFVMIPFLSFSAKLNITLSKNSLDLNTSDSIIYKFYLPSGAHTNIKFINIYGGGEIVFEENNPRSKGWHEVMLHSDSIRQGNYSSGVYYAEIVAMQGEKPVIEFNSFQGPWGKSIDVLNASLDETSGNISYEMPEFGMTRLRIGIQNAGVFRTYNWEAQTPGGFLKHWDGYDQTGRTYVLGKIPASVALASISLPKTCFSLQNKDQPINYSLELKYPKTANKLVISQQAELPWSNRYDTEVDFNVELTDSETIQINFPNFKQTKAMTEKLQKGANEFYLTIDGDFVIETDGIDLENAYSISIPSLEPGIHHFIVNLVFGPEFEPNTFIAIGIKELSVE